MCFTTFLCPLISSAHDTGAGISGKATGNPVHQHITREAGNVWSGMAKELKKHLANPRNVSLDFPCFANYDSGDDIVTGSGDEDQEWYPPVVVCPLGARYTNGFLEHFWDPDKPNVGGIAGYDKGFSDPNIEGGQEFASSYRKAQEIWDTKVICHYTGRGRNGKTCPVDKDQAYYWLGRIAHLLEDLAVPTHVHNVRHDWTVGLSPPFGTRAERDLFEDSVGAVFRPFKGFRYRGTEYRPEDLPCIPIQTPNTCAALKQNFDWTDIHPNPTNLFKLFWFTAQKTQYYATGGTVLGRQGDKGAYYKLNGDVGRFRPSLWEIEGKVPVEIPDDVPAKLSDMHFALIPHALRAVAGLYRLFWLEIHIDDNFNDNSLNLLLWEPYILPSASAGAVSETNRRLEIVLNAGEVNAGVRSRCSLTEDFDVQIDFSLLNWPPDNRQGFSLKTVDLGEGVFGGLGVERFSEGGEVYHMIFLDSAGPAVPTTDTAGTLRLKRTGSTLSGYYRKGKTFILLGSAPVNTKSTRIVLNGGLFRSDAVAASFAFDNFKVNAGTVQCPPFSSGTLLFTSNRNGNYDIYTISADGTGLANLTNNPANDLALWANPWSPDGSHIAFVSDRVSLPQIYVMNPDGTGRVTIDVAPATGDYNQAPRRSRG